MLKRTVAYLLERRRLSQSNDRQSVSVEAHAIFWNCVGWRFEGLNEFSPTCTRQKYLRG